MSKKTLLQTIQEEKSILKQSYLEDEKKLTENFAYLQENWGKLLVHSTVNGVKGAMRLPTDKKPAKDSNFQIDKIQQVATMGMTIFPIIWELSQPFLINYGIKKLKSFFTKKKKKKTQN